MAWMRWLLSALGMASIGSGHAQPAQTTEPIEPIKSSTLLPSKQVESRAEWVSVVAEHYAGVSAGVEINRICSILSASETAKLESDLEAFTQALSGQIIPDFLSAARRTSKVIASEEPYQSCGIESRDAVIDAQELVAWWLNELGKSDPGK